jgi:hypothetical protein
VPSLTLMTPKKQTEPQTNADRARQIRHLRELIAALDRRVPHVERSGEAAIARDAAALRDKALKRIAVLEGKSAELRG